MHGAGRHPRMQRAARAVAAASAVALDPAPHVCVLQAGHQAGQQPGDALSAEEAAFVATLNEDLARFNQFFIDKEEDSVIRLQVRACSRPGDRGAAPISREAVQARSGDGSWLSFSRYIYITR